MCAGRWFARPDGVSLSERSRSPKEGSAFSFDNNGFFGVKFVLNNQWG